MSTNSQILTLSLARKRALSLSLVGKQASSLLHDLPAEIIIHILELALLHDRPRDLASISQIIRHFINIIIYRTVVLDTSHTITLFHRTASSPRSSHLLEHVRRLAITWEPEYFNATTEKQLRGIVAQCPSLRAVAVPSCYQVNISPSGALLHDGPTDLTVQSFEDLNPDPLSSAVFLLPIYFSTSLTHLRICEPADKWQSPLSIIAALHGAPNLTHLELARRTDSNEDNDAIFVEDLAYLLTTRKELRMVVVSIFGGSMRTSLDALRESSIWMLVSKLQEVDSRVVITQGEPGSWREEWKDVKGFRCGRRPANFWDTVQERGSQEMVVE
ncbi:hypothetical protein P691DRAFT_807635 [Macrolepiota fuliginosa MF-IS2]|uniref:Uncharacterized protein n=1 Tax=Macrolepiota fuliginosa MF-IS2 TaxID=1400762 RepID=A0A9P6C7R7_9AGAR|nr:hypothetical protein P691DRAFT_807635 [Macrolepiota fuliginosa MF-IS2]